MLGAIGVVGIVVGTSGSTAVGIEVIVGKGVDNVSDPPDKVTGSTDEEEKEVTDAKSEDDTTSRGEVVEEVSELELAVMGIGIGVVETVSVIKEVTTVSEAVMVVVTIGVLELLTASSAEVSNGVSDGVSEGTASVVVVGVVKTTRSVREAGSSTPAIWQSWVANA